MTSERPNLLLLFVDQMRFDAIGALGNPVVRTPHLDRLVAEGTAFTDAWSPCPVCVPARCSLLFGQLPGRTGCADNGDPFPADTVPFPEHLRRAGYRTHGIGKCHYRPGEALYGFETRDTQEEVARRERDDYLGWLQEAGHGHVIEPHGVRSEMYYIPQVSPLPAAAHPSQWVGDRAVNFVGRQVGDERPWYCFTSFIHPHPPFAPPAPWHKLYRGPMMPLPHLPPDADVLQTWINRRQNRYKGRDAARDLQLWRVLKAHYYACISFIDYQVGRILDALAATGQLDETLIVFSSDHGELLGDFGCFGKRSFHDASARVPLVTRWPGRLPAGERCARPTSLVDVTATMLAAGRAEVDPGLLDGSDLLELAAGGGDREAVQVQFQHGPRAMHTLVTGDWKYVWSAGDDREFLFDRRRDPVETRNLAGNVHYRDVVTDLRARLIARLRAQGQTEGLVEDGWRRYEPVTLDADPDACLIIQDPPDLVLDLPGYSE